MRYMNLALWIGLLSAVGPCLPGCSLLDSHVREFDLMRGMAADAATRLADGATAQYQVSGQGLNPGIALEASIVYRAVARYEGLAGQFGVAAQGTLGPVNAETRSQILAIIRDQTLTREARERLILEILDRVRSAASTGAGQPSATAPAPTALVPVERVP